MRLRRQLLVLAGTVGCLSFAAYGVYSRKPAEPGHDLASTEKPQAMRKEPRRTLEQEKRALQALVEAREARERAGAAR